MPFLLHHLLEHAAQRSPANTAVLFKNQSMDYADLWQDVAATAGGLRGLGLAADQRVAVYLAKQPETVTALFATSLADGVFVPVNPVLKAPQVGHILRDCDVSILITNRARLSTLTGELQNTPSLRHVILVDDPKQVEVPAHCELQRFSELPDACRRSHDKPRIDADIAAILYTSGSTGRPKGVVLTHANMLAGARSVASYLNNRESDRLLAVLPFSFDYGLSQLTTAFLSRASVVLMDYLLPGDVIRAVEKFAVTGLAAVPPLWNQLATLPWPEAAQKTLRYLTNSGGAMPAATAAALRAALPDTQLFLMYGLTEAFRSTYLDPSQIDRRPGSMGKAIPNAQIMVVRPDGSECDVDEPGELVHRGALVARGYWNDAEKTAIRFRPAPGQPDGLVNPELAVWSGDRVRRDADGYLYFIGREDEMIKTSGYRVSPTEIEEVVMQLPSVEQAVAMAAPHPQLGQGVVLVVQGDCAAEDVSRHCQQMLPTYMMPGLLEVVSELPRNPNGKIDRSALAARYQNSFDAK
jgi:acyl-CoA ligase (AMP-forming) (exosortase A-associated)